jgi:pyruvate kinase
VDGPGVLHGLEPGARVLVDHGLVELQVVDKDETGILAEVMIGGSVQTRKGINLPDLDMPIEVSAKDHEDIQFAAGLGLELLAGSYMGRPEDVSRLRCLAQAAGGAPAIVAKLERALAISNLEGIIAAADLILVARGDLGVEVPLEKVPLLQKTIIEEGRSAKKAVIVATHLLESMVRFPRPTRAEVSDVANAVLDGAQVLLLTGETAAGAYPVEAVEIMARIIQEAEAYQVK